MLQRNIFKPSKESQDMSVVSSKTRLQRTTEWLAELLAMAFVSAMVLVSTLRLFRVLS
jgi:hypothetical protein